VILDMIGTVFQKNLRDSYGEDLRFCVDMGLRAWRLKNIPALVVGQNDANCFRLSPNFSKRKTWNHRELRLSVLYLLTASSYRLSRGTMLVSPSHFYDSYQTVSFDQSEAITKDLS
jgi:hypothetical protein